MSLLELKALGFDIVQQLNNLQQNMQILNAEITKKSGIEEKSKEEEQS